MLFFTTEQSFVTKSHLTWQRRQSLFVFRREETRTRSDQGTLNYIHGHTHTHTHRQTHTISYLWWCVASITSYLSHGHGDRSMYSSSYLVIWMVQGIWFWFGKSFEQTLAIFQLCARTIQRDVDVSHKYIWAFVRWKKKVWILKKDRDLNCFVAEAKLLKRYHISNVTYYYIKTFNVENPFIYFKPHLKHANKIFRCQFFLYVHIHYRNHLRYRHYAFISVTFFRDHVRLLPTKSHPKCAVQFKFNLARHFFETIWTWSATAFARSNNRRFCSITSPTHTHTDTPRFLCHSAKVAGQV